MSSSFNLTPFEPVYSKVEHLSFALGEFAKTPSDPKASETLEKLFNLLQTQMKELRDDVSFNPKHAMTWKDIYISIKRLHSVEQSVARKTQDAISFIIQTKLPSEMPEVNSIDHSILILTCDLNNCFDSLMKGQNIEENLKFAARILVAHYRLFKGFDLSGKTPVNGRQKAELRVILHYCGEGIKVLASKVPAVQSHPFFKKLTKLIFDRLEPKNWYTGLSKDIVPNILSFLPDQIESEQTIVEFLSQNPEEGCEALADWINHNRIPLARISCNPQLLKLLQPYLRFVDLSSDSLIYGTPKFDSNWDEKEIYDFIQNCTHIERLTINTDKITSLPPRIQQLCYLDCQGCKNLTKLPAGMVSLEVLDIMGCSFTVLPDDLISLKKLTVIDCSNLTVLPDNLIHLTVLYCNDTPLTRLPLGMKSLKVLHCGSTSISSLPKGMISLAYLNCMSCPLILGGFPDDLASLKIGGLYWDEVLDDEEHIITPQQYIPFLRSSWEHTYPASFDSDGELVDSDSDGELVDSDGELDD